MVCVCEREREGGGRRERGKEREREKERDMVSMQVVHAAMRERRERQIEKEEGGKKREGEEGE